MEYLVKAVKVKAGLFGTGDKDIEKAVQGELDFLSKQGWTLESCSVSGSDRGSMALLIFKK